VVVENRDGKLGFGESVLRMEAHRENLLAYTLKMAFMGPSWEVATANTQSAQSICQDFSHTLAPRRNGGPQLSDRFARVFGLKASPANTADRQPIVTARPPFAHTAPTTLSEAIPGHERAMITMPAATLRIVRRISNTQYLN
jgi:hypothetical protein